MLQWITHFLIKLVATGVLFFSAAQLPATPTFSKPHASVKEVSSEPKQLKEVELLHPLFVLK